MKRKRHNGAESSTHVQSAHLLPILSDLDCDVLLLFDSCQAIPPNIISTGKGVVSVLSATGFDSGVVGIAPGVGPHSFTRALIDELGVLLNRFVTFPNAQPTSDIGLHGNLLARLKVHLSTVEKDIKGRIKCDQNGGIVFERVQRRTPFYRFLSDNKRPRPIYIAPLPTNHDNTPGTEYDQPSSGKKKVKEIETKVNETENSKPPTPAPSAKDLPREEQKDIPKVLIRILLNTSTFSIDQFANWLLQAPLEARSVEIEGAYGSLSTLLVVKMPLSVWNLLPGDPAMSLIGYITSTNKADLINQGIRRKLQTSTTDSPSSTMSQGGPFVALSPSLGLPVVASTQSKAVYPDDWPPPPEPRQDAIPLGGAHYRCKDCLIELNIQRYEKNPSYLWYCVCVIILSLPLKDDSKATSQL